MDAIISQAQDAFEGQIVGLCFRALRRCVLTRVGL